MGLKDRLMRLEGGREDGSCTCGIVAILVNGQFHRARRHGVPMSEEEWRAHKALDADGVCGTCGGGLSPPIKVGGADHAPRTMRRLREGSLE